MFTILLVIVGMGLWCPLSVAQVAQQSTAASTILFWEEGFPAADTATPNRSVLATISPDLTLVSAQELGTALARPTSRLLVLPFGSAFPEEEWERILDFLERGGNLLVLGGRPFTRAAYRTASGWRLRDYSVRFSRRLMIDQYEETPGSSGSTFLPNPDVPLKLTPFAWTRAYSPIIRLSAVDLYHRGGSAGSLDARIDALAWGAKDRRKFSAPAIVIDHFRNGFDGGRWVFFNSSLSPEFYSSQNMADLVRDVAEFARRGGQEFTVRPALPLYLPNEPVQLDVTWNTTTPAQSQPTLKIALYAEGQPNRLQAITRSLPLAAEIAFPAPPGKGLYRIDAEVVDGNRVVGIYHSGFWIRDETYMRSGPRLTVNHDYFELEGHPIAVVGTTYMSSEVQRLFFEHPNVYVWDRDLGEISTAGLNMIRTGWWTGWDKVCDENGKPYERTLRTLEAYLMTARKYGLPVQFNFFAFLPEVLGGTNAYLDPEAVRKQQTLVSAVVKRFHDVPYLAWDLINEPSFSQRLWTMRPNGDAVELAQWNQWLDRRYPDRAALANAWNLPVSAVKGTVSAPSEPEFTWQGTYIGKNSLKFYDFSLFAQESFANWVKAMQGAIRTTGSTQLITVGQDEGGYSDRLFPGFFASFIDFTVNHSWWQNDSLLWDSLVAKQPGLPMLVQETGLQRELTLDEIARRTPEEEAALFERKMANSFVAGSGAIEWLWNLNEYMTESNESPIGAVRADGTEKPEATVMRGFAAFAKILGRELRNPEPSPVTIVTSHAAQYSVLSDLQLEAQRRAVRALVYHARVTGSFIAENQIEKLGSPKLVILPSPQSLTDQAWKALMGYVADGGNLLVTGAADRDEHWHPVKRATDFDAQAAPLTAHQVELRLDGQLLSFAFDQRKQTLLERLRFTDGQAFKEAARGKGHIFWMAYPVELADDLEATAKVYAYVLDRVGLAPGFEISARLSPGVMIYPTVLQDAVLYVISSESAQDEDIDIRDKTSGGRLKFRLPAQHAALAIISKSNGGIQAKYGF